MSCRCGCAIRRSATGIDPRRTAAVAVVATVQAVLWDTRHEVTGHLGVRASLRGYLPVTSYSYMSDDHILDKMKIILHRYTVL